MCLFLISLVVIKIRVKYMATWILDIFYTKKRSNQKYWDHQKSVWCKVTVQENIIGSGKRTIRNPRCADSRYIYRNIPDSWTMQDLEAWQPKVICMTPFGIPKFEHDYNEILAGKSENGSVSYAIIPDTLSSEMVPILY